MSLGLHETRLRRKRRVRWTIAKWVLALGAILAAGIFAYQSGSSLARREVTSLKQEIEELTATVDKLQSENTDLAANVIVVEKRLQDANARYEQDVPTGEMAALFQKLQEKKESGVTTERLEFLIESAENPRDCTPEATSKRFLVQTPLYQGANDSVRFADGKVTVTASGEPAKDDSGNVEAWYDEAQPVTVRFIRIGGKTTEETGKLPIHASVVLDKYEYRFTVEAGPRGFVLVTGDRCNYP